MSPMNYQYPNWKWRAGCQTSNPRLCSVLQFWYDLFRNC
jgi:hypothetical protein